MRKYRVFLWISKFQRIKINYKWDKLLKPLDSKQITYCSFFASTTLLVIYLLSMRWQVYLPILLFWLVIALNLVTIVYQIFRIKLSPSFVAIVLLEIAITSYFFHMIFQIPSYGLFGSDSYVDLASTKDIIVSGHLMGAPQYFTEASSFPIIHLFGASLAMITGIDLFSVAKWFPSLFDAILVPLYYLFIRSVFKEKRIALISSLLFVCLQNHIAFSSLFIRQTYGLILAVLCVYFYFSANHSPTPKTNGALSITCLILTVFTHHLTGFMLSIFLLVHLLVTRAFDYPFFRKVYSKNNIKGEKITKYFLLLTFVTLFTYWLFAVVQSPLYTTPINALASLAKNIFTIESWGANTYAVSAGITGAQIQSIRGYFIFYGFYLFNAIFILMLLYGLMPRAKNLELSTILLRFTYCSAV